MEKGQINLNIRTYLRRLSQQPKTTFVLCSSDKIQVLADVFQLQSYA